MRPRGLARCFPIKPYRQFDISPGGGDLIQVCFIHPIDFTRLPSQTQEPVLGRQAGRRRRVGEAPSSQPASRTDTCCVCVLPLNNSGPADGWTTSSSPIQMARRGDIASTEGIKVPIYSDGLRREGRISGGGKKNEGKQEK